MTSTRGLRSFVQLPTAMVVRSVQQFEALRDEWEALSAPFRSPLLDHDWCLSCAEAFHGDDQLHAVMVRDRHALVGIAPLAYEATPAGKRLMLLGGAHLYEPGGWLFASTAALAELIGQTVALGRPMVLQRIPAGSPLCEAIDRLPLHQALTASGGSTTSLFVPTRSSWDEYYAGLSSQITSNLPRLLRKAERTVGKALVVAVEPEPSDVDALLETVVTVEGSGWKGRRGSSLGARTDLREFFRRYCHRAAGKQQLRVTTLSFGGEVAAVEVSVEAYQRMWQLKIGYNDALSAYYPGLHLTQACIQAAFARRLEAYEFLGSAAVWEERWLPEPRRYRTMAVYPITPSGVVTVCRDVAAHAWRRAHAMIRQPAPAST